MRIIANLIELALVPLVIFDLGVFIRSTILKPFSKIHNPVIVVVQIVDIGKVWRENIAYLTSAKDAKLNSID